MCYVTRQPVCRLVQLDKAATTTQHYNMQSNYCACSVHRAGWLAFCMASWQPALLLQLTSTTHDAPLKIPLTPKGRKGFRFAGLALEKPAARMMIITTT